MKKLVAASVVALSSFLSIATAQQKDRLVVQVDKPVAEVQPTMWGIFFEDINLGADGGIYAELVKNRSFEFYKPMMGWTVKQNKFNEGSVLVLNRLEKNTPNPRYIRVSKKEAADSLSLANEGFRGMGLKKGLRYDFSVMYRQPSAGIQMELELISSSGKILGSASLTPAATTGEDWKKATVSLVSSDSSLKGR
ncbi:MAG: alpha-L-arabinofuranosidase, partial [Ferruginibacter sp.]|nr:alpha-L-arabinofuranosidase [Ferruginibacter sp.]